MPLALVTGANRGLGLETARRLGAQGWSLLLAIRTEAEGRAATTTLAKEGVDARALTIDLSDGPAIDRFAARIASEGPVPGSPPPRGAGLGTAPIRAVARSPTASRRPGSTRTPACSRPSSPRGASA